METYTEIIDLKEYMKSFDLSTIKYVNSDYWKFESKWMLTAHAHDFIEMIYMLEGQAYINIPGKTMNLANYSLIVYPQNAVHQEFSDVYHPQKTICIGVKIENNVKLDKPFVISDNEGHFRWLFQRINEEIRNGRADTTEVVHAYLKSIFLLIQRHCQNYDKSKDIMSMCIRYFHDYYSEEICLEKLASNFYVSPSCLIKLFKRNVGSSPMHYLNTVRIEESKRMLVSSSFSINEISSAIGFNDSLYFSRIFKKTTNLTPTEYRKQFMPNLPKRQTN